MNEEEGNKKYKDNLEFVRAMAELDSKEKEIKISQGFRKAYFWSIVFPPIGFFYFIKYIFFSGGENSKIKAGVISLILTLISLFISFFLMFILFQKTTSSIPPQNFQMLKDLAVPENQKKLLDLYK